LKLDRPALKFDIKRRAEATIQFSVGGRINVIGNFTSKIEERARTDVLIEAIDHRKTS
jgi:hypothetical protein